MNTQTKEFEGLKSKNIFVLLRRLLKFVKPFFGLLAMLLVVNSIYSILSAISIAAIIKPVFQILFEENVPVELAPASAGLLESLKNNFYYYMNSLFVVKGDIAATLFNLSLLIILLFLAKNIFKYWGQIISVNFEQGLLKNIRDSLFRKLTSLSVDFFAKRKEGNIISIITNDVSVINNTTVNSFTNFFREIVQVFVFIFYLVSISPQLTLIAFSTSIISLSLLRLSMKFLRRYASRMQSSMASYTSILNETIYGIRIVKAFNAETSSDKRFENETKRFVRSAVKERKIISFIPSINEMFAILALCVVFFVGGKDVLSGTMKADELMVFLFALFAIMSPIVAVTSDITKFQRGFVATERVLEILDQEPTVIDGKEKIETFDQSIDVKNVSFSYDNKTQVLKNVSFKINKCKKTAFVGLSGSGKSTMLDLLIRFYDPVNGDIFIDDRNIKTLNTQDYRSLFGIVTQESMLFNDTIANNIRYGLENISQDDIENASKLANAHSFITKFPEGYNSIVGDRGVKLSGGEKQRIAIARALIRNPYVLLFDEATSALDSESEKIVQNAIDNSLENKTAVIIAHRLATIINCDEILVFDNGEIAERGNHFELIEKNGIYKKLYDIQFAKKSLS